MAKTLLVAAVAAFLAAGALVSHGVATDGRLTACAKEENGQLRLVETDAECIASETAVSWSVGTGGGASFVTVTASVPPAPGIVTATATCPPGGRVVGGGAHAVPDNGGNVLGDYPVDDSAWRATVVVNTFANPQSIVVYAICAIAP